MSRRPSFWLGNVEVLDLGKHLHAWRDVGRDVCLRIGILCHALAVRVIGAFAGCKGRRELSDLLSIRLANVVIVDDESHVKKSRDVTSSRSGILCHGLAVEFACILGHALAVRVVESCRICCQFGWQMW
jgi:hypothetical protein